ncbi:hypothetical protein KKP62_06345 [Rhodococcus sp. GOMB7]|uniref:hypothetical protein n=1 Tax=Rhodococcus TaxID=1827 RepID=UPI0004A9084B|nr:MULTISPECIES: hypothetical protein [Rhodococcus]KDQ00522.1 hypothetical protein EN35_31680 [Rhodococcus qingshengii]MBT9294586.1 hypothetical protein [Rhodococcus sp. GOMB7]MBX9146369.1 hypothetical protein [Rhodococcus qingshengii]
MIGIFYGLVFMNLLFVTSTVCLMKPSTASVVVTVCAGVAWLFFNGPLEGQVLWSLNREHGLTVSDLMSLVAFGIAARGWNQVRKARETVDADRF